MKPHHSPFPTAADVVAALNELTLAVSRLSGNVLQNDDELWAAWSRAIATLEGIRSSSVAA